MERHYVAQEKEKDRSSNIIISVLVFLVLSMAVFRVIIANAQVEASEKLKNLDKEIAVLESENQLREEKLRAQESLVKLETKAAKKGFEKTGKYAFVEPEKSVAMTFDEFHN